ncbi:hypothetical protein Leryth_018935 [Lithospermum erythrorhizon]|nr:hypothetical protein Leryth_018935 [Lithospermum erythrorhizon]
MASTVTSSLCTPLYAKNKRNTILHKKERRALQVSAIGRDAHDHSYNNRGIVDENMIILRRRIKEMKMIERNYEPPNEWMDWEKKCYANYNVVICDAMGIVQALLMNSRPSLALGLALLIVLSVPFFSVIVVYQFFEFIKVVLAGIHFL